MKVILTDWTIVSFAVTRQFLTVVLSQTRFDRNFSKTFAKD